VPIPLCQVGAFAEAPFAGNRERTLLGGRAVTVFEGRLSEAAGGGG